MRRITEADYTIDPDGCWIWNGSRNTAGYGTIWFASQNWLTHRIMFIQTYGMIPRGKVLHHRCYKKLCIRPTCLEPTSREQNLIQKHPAPPQSS